ncbi:MAG TPA: TonB-dependent receptor [Candidatus Acidoferrum sp.]|nr:TonB-dependent receptor [Candidatus Acidoferrum sp.]
MKRLVIAVLIAFSLAVAANAQTFRGSINGTVSDPSGGLVPNATVKATEIATGLDHTATTTSEGAFAFQDIPLGLYKVTVTATGFPTYTVDKVEVVAGQIYTLNVKLTLQQQSTTVEVSAAALTLDTTTQTQTMTIPDDVVQNIPLNGRDFTQLISVQPGFGGYNVGGFGSLNGTRPNQINWQIDGVDNNDFWHNIPAVNQGGVSGIAGVVLPIDSVVEFSSQTSSGPEGGRNAGGTVNVVTKSGTNEIHGSAYYYNRNEYFSEPSPFFCPSIVSSCPSGNPPKNLPHRNENYGFSAGGPIIKNKTFIFANYEKQDFVFGESGIATEPSTAWVALATDILNNPVCAPITPTCTTRKYGNYAPVAPSAASANAIGANGFWPQNIIGSLPATTNNFFSPTPETGYSYNGVARLDQQISDKHHLYLRVYGGQGNQIAPLGGSPALGTASSNLAYYFEVAPIHVFNYSAVLNSTLTSKITNQLLFGSNYFNQIFHDSNNGFNTQAMGLFLSPSALKAGKYINGAPNIVIAPPSTGGSGGFEQIGLTPPEGRSDLTWHITDVVSYSTGAHQFRFGGEVRDAHLDEFYHRRGTGQFVFDGTAGPWAGSTTCTNNPLECALADFLAGDVSSCTDTLHSTNGLACGGNIAVGNPERWVSVKAFNLYLQDSWQITKKLNINYGLRYEYFGPMSSGKGDIANFVPGTGFYVANGSHPLFKPGKDHFAPRLGLAYQPSGKGDLVVRAGFGVFYDQINLNPFLDFRPPVSGAPQGIEGNPFGPSPISTFSSPFCGTLANGSFQWDAVQAATCPAGYTNAGMANSNKSVFGPVQGCTNVNCLDAGDPTGLGVYSVSPNFRTPYFFNYNLQVEKSFGNAAVLQIGYVGSEGRKLNIVSNLNQNGAFSQFGPILQLNTIGTSNYNSLQTVFRTRAWRGFSSQFAYTWAHSLDEVSEYRGAILTDFTNPKLDYGNSDFDTRNLFTLNFNYDVPKAPWATSNWSKQVFNNWQVSSMMIWHSGQPSDEGRLGLDLIGNPYAGVVHSFTRSIPGVQWWNPAAFCSPGGLACPGSTDNLSRNKFTGPGFGDVDMSFIKNIPITERVKLQLRADFFNLLNRINFASGVGSVGSVCAPPAPVAPATKSTGICTTNSGFGQVTDTIGDFNGAPAIGPGEARNIQLVAKIIF